MLNLTSDREKDGTAVILTAHGACEQRKKPRSTQKLKINRASERFSNAVPPVMTAVPSGKFLSRTLNITTAKGY